MDTEAKETQLMASVGRSHETVTDRRVQTVLPQFTRLASSHQL